MQQIMSQIRLKGIFILTLASLATAALFGGVIHLVLVAANVAEPAATTVYGMTVPRFWATFAAVLAFVSVGIGGLALARPGIRFGIVSRRLGASIALIAGFIAVVSGGLILAVADGGPNSGNGVVGGAGALVLGLVGVIISTLALVRSRHIG